MQNVEATSSESAHVSQSHLGTDWLEALHRVRRARSRADDFCLENPASGVWPSSATAMYNKQLLTGFFNGTRSVALLRPRASALRLNPFSSHCEFSNRLFFDRRVDRRLLETFPTQKENAPARCWGLKGVGLATPSPPIGATHTAEFRRAGSNRSRWAYQCGRRGNSCQAETKCRKPGGGKFHDRSMKKHRSNLKQ